MQPVGVLGVRARSRFRHVTTAAEGEAFGASLQRKKHNSQIIFFNTIGAKNYIRRALSSASLVTWCTTEKYMTSRALDYYRERWCRVVTSMAVRCMRRSASVVVIRGERSSYSFLKTTARNDQKPSHRTKHTSAKPDCLSYTSGV